MKIGFIGVGKLGMPCAEAIAKKVTYEYRGFEESQSLYCKIEKGSIVIDPWRTFVSDEHLVIHYGNTRI
jgi:3-hydroxyisobutyrate dehydrogenase-like beta-hydroxyacid dehydrogenase